MNFDNYEISLDLFLLWEGKLFLLYIISRVLVTDYTQCFFQIIAWTSFKNVCWKADYSDFFPLEDDHYAWFSVSFFYIIVILNNVLFN